MSELPEPKTDNPHESTWDHHGSYQWTYFAEEIKQRIQYFLLQRLHGRNIEIGGGWYLSYPDSVVVDLSSVCLEHNPAKEKLQFDLDTIANGRRLPYEDDSFNSATLISVWQYLRHPKAVLGELERILRTGAEIYLINGQGGGLEECVVGTSRAESVEKFFQEMGYDTLVEHIPDFDDQVNEFQSVCVAMPDKNQLGGASSRIQNKAQRKKKDEEVCQDPSIFIDAYIGWEMRNAVLLLEELSSFPVTRYSQGYLERIEAFSQEYHRKTGAIPLVFLEYGFEPELAMLLPDYDYLHSTMFLIGVEEAVKFSFDGPEEEILQRYGLSFSKHYNYFNQPTTKALLEYCHGFKLEREDSLRGTRDNETEVRTLADFISSLGLNSFTVELQTQVYERFKKNISDLDERVKRQSAFGYHMAVSKYKQKRKIDKLIEIKERIDSDGIPVVETRKLDYAPIVPKMREFIR